MRRAERCLCMQREPSTPSSLPLDGQKHMRRLVTGGGQDRQPGAGSAVKEDAK
jgi:hypothetical protein